MTASIITTLTLFGLWGLIKLWEKYQRSESDKILKRITEVTTPSYSIMTILTKPTIEIKTRLEKLIESSDYEIAGLINIKGSFANWNDKIYFDTENLRKGIIELTDSTVFNDPESIMITDREKIRQLSKDLNCKVLVTIWERVSMTIIFDEYNCGVLNSTTSVTEGKADNDNKNPKPDLLKKSDGDKLKVVLMNCGVNIKELFDKENLNVIEYKLKYTA